MFLFLLIFIIVSNFALSYLKSLTFAFLYEMLETFLCLWLVLRPKPVTPLELLQPKILFGNLLDVSRTNSHN
jgi:hypothetical protein